MEIFEDGFEGAAIAAMIEFYLRDAAGVERGGPFAAGGFEELGFGDENKVRVPVYEPLDEPGAGDAVHLHVLTSDPFHGGSPVLVGYLGKETV
jgi:hypothetical protein